MKELKVKRWLLFAGQNYYPAGGILDYRGSFISLGDALEWLTLSAPKTLDWAQVVPTYKGRVRFLARNGAAGHWRAEDRPGDCECHCGHPLASKCGHQFVDGVCSNCQEQENHGNHGGVS